MSEPVPSPRRDDLAQQIVVEQVAALTTSDEWVAMLAATSKFPDYSPRNALLLALQGAQGRVAGYRAWQSIPSSDGTYCQVRQGARSLKVLAPVMRRSVETDAVTGEEKRLQRPTGWRPVSVFDERSLIAPPELPVVAPKLLDGATPEGLWDALVSQIHDAGFALVDRDVSPANGVTDYVTRTVAVRGDLPELQRIKTLTHELAHVVMHAPERRPEGLTRAAAEVEAESVAFIVLAGRGIDASAYTFPYVAHWANGDPTSVVATATRVVETARVIGDSIEIALNKEHTLNATQPTDISNDQPWTIATADGGRWAISYDAAARSMIARHDNADGTPNHTVGAETAPTTVGMLETTLGFAIPHEMSDELRRRQPLAHRHEERPVNRLELAPSERPSATSAVEDPLGRSHTYGAMLQDEGVERHWTDGNGLVVETWPVGDDSHAAYRVTHNDDLVSAGELDPRLDPASDDALRTAARSPIVVRNDLDPELGSALLALGAVPQHPYEPGTHIAVRDDRRGETELGYVVAALSVDGKGFVGYEWRPDTSRIAGHPWLNYDHTQTAAPDHVTATLKADDIGLPEPGRSLAFGAKVEVGGIECEVIRAFDAPGKTHAYEVRPDGGTAMQRISTADIDRIVSGTAWPNAQALIDARAEIGVPLIAGERLETRAETIWIDKDGKSIADQKIRDHAPLDVPGTPKENAASSVDDESRLPPPLVVKVNIDGDTAKIGDPVHGWLNVKKPEFMAALKDPPEKLVEQLAKRIPKIALHGTESHITLAALTATPIAAPLRAKTTESTSVERPELERTQALATP